MISWRQYATRTKQKRPFTSHPCDLRNIPCLQSAIDPFVDWADSPKRRPSPESRIPREWRAAQSEHEHELRNAHKMAIRSYAKVETKAFIESFNKNIQESQEIQRKRTAHWNTVRSICKLCPNVCKNLGSTCDVAPVPMAVKTSSWNSMGPGIMQRARCWDMAGDEERSQLKMRHKNSNKMRL